MSVDMIVVGESVAGVCGRDASWPPRQGRDVWIVSRDGLIAMKRIAGRPQDLADIAALEGATDDDEA